MQFRSQNRCQALVNIIDQAAYQVRELPRSLGSRTHTDAMIGDFLHVVIGEGMMEEGRDSFFAGNVSGASGFRAAFRGNFNQFQHAAAGA